MSQLFLSSELFWGLNCILFVRTCFPSRQLSRPIFFCAVDLEATKPAGGNINITSQMEGYDGILIRNVGRCFEQHGMDRTWLSMVMGQIMDVTAAVNAPLVVEMGQPPILELDLSNCNGVLLLNPTTSPAGTPTLMFGSEHDAMQNFVRGLKAHMSMTHEFAVFTLYLAPNVDAVLPQTLERLRSALYASK